MVSAWIVAAQQQASPAMLVGVPGASAASLLQQRVEDLLGSCKIVIDFYLGTYGELENFGVDRGV
jgi:hypothetical protein